MKHTMKYNQYSIEHIRALVAEGSKLSKQYGRVEEMLHATDYSLQEAEFIILGFEYPDFVPGEIKEYYRIGEPRIDEWGVYTQTVIILWMIAAKVVYRW